jgi:hypothetical protein
VASMSADSDAAALGVAGQLGSCLERANQSRESRTEKGL